MRRKCIADLPDRTITIILELQRRLVQLINQAGATELSVFEIFGETEATASVLEQLTNIRVTSYFFLFSAF